MVILLLSLCIFFLNLENSNGFDSLVTPFTTAPPFYTTTRVHHPVQPENYGTIKRPYKTNNWWTTVGISSGTASFSALPYSLSATYGGMQACVPNVQTTAGAVNSNCPDILQLGSQENIGRHVITAFDDYLTLTLQYDALQKPECPGFAYFQGGYDLKGNDLFQVTGDPEDCCAPCAARSDCGGFTWYGGTCYMKSGVTGSALSFGRVSSVKTNTQFKPYAPGSITYPIAHGMPYVTAVYDNLTPFITSASIVSVNGMNLPANISASQFVIKMQNGQSWVLFSSKELTLNCSNTALKATSVFNGWLRLANVFDGAAATISLLQQYQGAIPISGKVDYGVISSTTATITFTWQLASYSTSQNLLMFAMPHHLDLLTNPQTVSLSVVSSLGTLVGVIGNPWTLNENTLPTISWICPHGIIDCNKKDQIFQSLADWQYYDPGPFSGHNGSIYWYDKGIWKLARLALIADEFGAPDIAITMRNTLKKNLEPLLLGQVENPWIYEPTWGGTLPNDTLGSYWIDYGSGWYNDHHFHLGYMLYTIAAIAKADLQWGQKFKPQVLDLLRDIVNPVADQYFPATRHFDWYCGHSWAGGVFSGSRNQESSSEAVNAYYGTYLYGLAVGDAHIENVGKVLLASEIRGAQKYWHIRSVDKIYKSPFADNKVVGIRWEDGANYGTFFSADPQDIHLIQMLPFSPISEQLLPSDWITEQFPVLERTRTAGWEDLIASNQAIIEPAQAWTAIFNVTFGAGTTLPDSLYWIATRPSNGPGTICTKTYPLVPCTGSCCADLLAVQSAGLSDGNFVYLKRDYRALYPTPGRGFNVVVLNSQSHTVLHNATYDTYGNAQATNDLISLLNSIPGGSYVLVGIQDSVANPVASTIITALQGVGATQAGNISFRGSYALLGVKGGKALAEKVTATGAGPASIAYQFTCSTK